ncbi:hypothetical protein PAHAL_4G311500 [Panicum hallii]|uniref:Uncharacterized protein n=1 Tax=Panicum hallii TaxID=206008 RepID=A0A2T8JEK4_9POAL|nr:hypothetical protein PAHAL_4G311500 [Panicum hallii]
MRVGHPGVKLKRDGQSTARPDRQAGSSSRTDSTAPTPPPPVAPVSTDHVSFLHFIHLPPPPGAAAVSITSTQMASPCFHGFLFVPFHLFFFFSLSPLLWRRCTMHPACLQLLCSGAAIVLGIVSTPPDLRVVSAFDAMEQTERGGAPGRRGEERENARTQELTKKRRRSCPDHRHKRKAKGTAG